MLSHASGHDTSASRLFTIVPFRHSLNKNTHSTMIAIYLMPAHRKCKRLPGLWATESFIVSEPAEGVQTLSEHDALSWLQWGKADGAVNLCGVGHEVLFVRRQKVHVVPLPLNLLSLHTSSNKEKTTVFKRIAKKFEEIRYGFATQTIITFPWDWNSFWKACEAKRFYSLRF